MNNTTYYFPERQYRSSLGRWLSPDPAGMSAVDPSSPQSWNRYAYVRNNPLSNIDPDGLDCVYLGPRGDNIESVDANSDSGECGSNGGFWVDGTFTNGWYGSNTNDIYLQGNDNGQFTDSYSNVVTTNSPGNIDTGGGFTGSFFQLGAGTNSVSLTPSALNIVNQVGLLVQPFTKQVNCAAAGLYPFIPGVKPEDVTGALLDAGEKAAGAAASNHAETADGIKATFQRGMGKGKMQRQVATLTRQAQNAEKLGKFLEGAGYVLAAKDSLENFTKCEENP